MKGKRVEVDDGGLKRAANGSAFIRCEDCNKDIPVAIADMHNCGSDLATKARLQQSNVAKPVQEAPKKKKSSEESKETTKKRGGKEKKSKEPAKKKTKKDPNMPKRPLSGFFLFMEDFRKTKKEENAKVKPSEMTKLGGERWKEMSDEEKAPYTQRAAELKAEYEAEMKKYKGGKDGAENETKSEDEADADADADAQAEAGDDEPEEDE